VVESGVLQHPELLTLGGLVAHLRAQPELIDDWLLYSGDKRTGSGWYFRGTDKSRFEVGFHPDGPRREFADAAAACAEFIWLEMREVILGSRASP
jgi:hypothetical protein